MSYSKRLAVSLGTGLLALTASAAPAGAASQRKSARTNSATANAASAGGGNGGAGLTGPSKTDSASGTADGTSNPGTSNPGGSNPGGSNAGTSGPQSSANLPHLGDRVLKRGMQGRDVRVLQDYLTRVGFPTHIDGQFGSGTARNVRAFQRSLGLPANGVVSLLVSNALRAAVSKAQKSSGGPVGTAVLNSNGTVTAPSGAPATVRNVIAAANKIAFKPYIYGGGHASWNDGGYDCSGSVSYALHGGNLLSSPMASGEFESYGSPGRGRWITIYANPSHMYMVIAGMRYDTVAQDTSNNNDRWTSSPASSSEGSFVVRHPNGW